MQKFILTGIFLFLLVLVLWSPIPKTELEHKELPYKTTELQNRTGVALQDFNKTENALKP